MKSYISVSAASLDTLYQVMKKRIEKGLKAEDLSFLIGKSQDYVDSIEYFNASGYNVQDLKSIASALQDHSIEKLQHIYTQQIPLIVSMERHLFESRYFHVCTTYASSGQEFVRFILTEDQQLKPTLTINRLENYQRKLMIQQLSIMLEEGYFSFARLPYEIYQHINQKTGLVFCPQLLKKVLNDFCLDDVIGGLEMIKEYQQYHYIESAAQMKSLSLTLKLNTPCMN